MRHPAQRLRPAGFEASNGDRVQARLAGQFGLREKLRQAQTSKDLRERHAASTEQRACARGANGMLLRL